jgi:hypothetical protein
MLNASIDLDSRVMKRKISPALKYIEKGEVHFFVGKL